MVRVFYYDEETGDYIDSLQPEVCSKQKALSLFNVLTEIEESFFGLVNNDNETLQFLCVDDDEWRVDIPIPKKDGALFCYTDRNTCIELIKCLYDNIPITYYVHLEFERF